MPPSGSNIHTGAKLRIKFFFPLFKINIRNHFSNQILILCLIYTKYFPRSGYKGVKSVSKLVEDYMNKKLKVDEFVTHMLLFEKITEGFELMHAGKW